MLREERPLGSLRWRAGGQGLRHLGRKIEVGEDAPHHGRVLERGEEAEPTAARCSGTLDSEFNELSGAFVNRVFRVDQDPLRDEPIATRNGSVVLKRLRPSLDQ